MTTQLTLWQTEKPESIEVAFGWSDGDTSLQAAQRRLQELRAMPRQMLIAFSADGGYQDRCWVIAHNPHIRETDGRYLVWAICTATASPLAPTQIVDEEEFL